MQLNILDFDEYAANGSSLCPWVKGICINTYRSYRCSCEKGWAMNNDNQSCYGMLCFLLCFFCSKLLILLFYIFLSFW